MKAKEKLREAEILLRESYSALQIGIMNNSLTRRITHYLNLPDVDEEKIVSGNVPIYVPDSFEKEAERYHKKECEKCKKLSPSLEEYKKNLNIEIDDIIANN